MSMKDGGAAFPFPERVRDGDGCNYGPYIGMSLRDYFAAQALIGMYAGGGHRSVAEEIAKAPEAFCLTSVQIGHAAEEQIAVMAYAVADAMLKAREK